MNRIDICKNIIQSIKEYITNPEKLEPHRAKNHFVRKRKLSLQEFYINVLLSNLSCAASLPLLILLFFQYKILEIAITLPRTIHIWILNKLLIKASANPLGAINIIYFFFL